MVKSSKGVMMRFRIPYSYSPKICGICNKFIYHSDFQVYVSGDNGRRDYYAHIDCIKEREMTAGKYKPSINDAERE